uniref:Uncharacterized protein n=1 Tax=Amphora coffeiformis TaxID=265554 RepID=A0A7S3L7B4_9STRA
MLRPRVKKRVKAAGHIGTPAPVATFSSRHDEKRRKASAGLRSSLISLLGSNRVRCIGALFLFLMFVLVLSRESLGVLVDTVVQEFVINRQDWVPNSTPLVSAVKHWPAVEMRNRKTVKDYQNAYLEAVLGKNTSGEFTGQGETTFTPVVQGRGEAVIVDVPSSNNEWWQMYSLKARLLRAKCHPGWWCQRCLSYPLAGSLLQCQMLCERCFVKALTITKTIALPVLPIKQLKQGDEFDLQDDENSGSFELLRTIPRTIYHVGRFETRPTMMSHPDWIRVQNTWRSQSGYEYYSYATINQQRLWIHRSFPPIFLLAFDSLAGDSRQAHLFGLLILFRKGGIMAYMDLMLETHLETFLFVDRLSFVAAVDSRTSPYLSGLYPGFVAARSGHPIVGRAIMSLMHVVAVEVHETWDQMGEVASYLARFFDVHSLEMWRTRFASDICPLGVAVHQTLGHVSPYMPLELGAVSLTEKEKALFLLLSDYDTGATRISDVGRNLLIASTGMEGWTEDPVQRRSQTNIRKLMRKGGKQNHGRFARLAPIEFAYQTKDGWV